MNNRVQLFDIRFDAIDMNQAVSTLLGWVRSGSRQCQYVVTPNVDHVVKLEMDARFRKSYQDASMVVADGKPVVMASRLFGKPLPAVVPGSDLVPGLFDRAWETGRPVTVFLFGAGPGVADRAARKIAERWGDDVKVVGTHCPEAGFDTDPVESMRLARMIAATNPDILILGLGAPKQELWINQYRGYVNAGVALCVGATIDFLAGERKRAPGVLRRLALEWAYRIYQEPKRLAGRYAHDAVVFPRLVVKEYLSMKARH